LEPHKELVRDVMMVVEGNNPDNTFEQVLDKTKVKVEEILEKQNKMPKGKPFSLADLDEEIGAL
jgi:hypothetical protein